MRIPYSDEFADIVDKLLIKAPSIRLGTVGDAGAILAHPWFTDTNAEHYIDIEKIKNRTEMPVVEEEFFSRNNLKYFNYK